MRYLKTQVYGSLKVKVLITQSSLTLCDPIDCSPPGSSVHGILQARILDLVAIHFSRDLLDAGIEPGSPALQADSLLSSSVFFLPSETGDTSLYSANRRGRGQWSANPTGMALFNLIATVPC